MPIMSDLLHYLQAQSTSNHCFVPHQTFSWSANSGQFQDGKFLQNIFGFDWEMVIYLVQSTDNFLATMFSLDIWNPHTGTQVSMAILTPTKYNCKTYNSPSTNYCSNVPFALCKYHYTTLSLIS